ncbi:MAG: FCD domain-containing protein [Anaerolineae bacterium]|nr:FCD domain-containing protein [Anaerolineae bacterium]
MIETKVMLPMPHIDLESELLNFIANGDYEPGDRLPTISELQSDDLLGLSTSKIREQLEVARALGLVEVRSKTGMRLKEYSFTPAVRLSLFCALAKDLGHFELFSELRKHIEIAFWNEACALLTPEDKDELKACVEQARWKLNNQWIQIPTVEHRQFHMIIFRRLNNPFVVGLLEAYWDAYEAVELNRYSDYDYLQRVWEYHGRILDAICADDIAGAQQLYIEHTQLLRYQPRMRDMSKP